MLRHFCAPCRYRKSMFFFRWDRNTIRRKSFIGKVETLSKCKFHTATLYSFGYVCVCVCCSMGSIFCHFRVSFLPPADDSRQRQRLVMMMCLVEFSIKWTVNTFYDKIITSPKCPFPDQGVGVVKPCEVGVWLCLEV